jgi:hypothetical protein
MLEYVTTHGAPFLSGWDIHGANRDNTDNGRSWVRVAQGGGEFTVTLYRDSGRIEAVAAGTLDSATGKLDLSQLNDSGLAGSVRLGAAVAGDAIIDIFYACDEDLTARQSEIAGFLKDGNFAGREGFSEPCLRAKRVLDAMIEQRTGDGWIADDLQPLAEPAAQYALHYIYDYLSTRADDAAAQLAQHFKRQARASLARLEVSIGGCPERLFVARLIRT